METKGLVGLYLAVVAAVGAIAILFIFGMSRFNGLEQPLFGVLLFLLAVAAGALGANYFAFQQTRAGLEELKTRYAEDLRTHAAKAADNVENLSGELQRFASFLEAELKHEFKDASEGYLSRTERIESSIHILNTLRSVNQASLSEWRNVLPGPKTGPDAPPAARPSSLKPGPAA